MKFNLEPGLYVLAVSGGVDSVALLDMLTNLPKVKLVVAHFDHGIREDSGADKVFVESLAQHYGLTFISAAGHLGPEASEATAREARYRFLRSVKKSHGALAIITAHHEDDVIETVFLNLLRGTNRKGLNSLRSTSSIKRPLLNTSKKDLQAYAKAHGLEWHEDSTNLDDKYLRNYLRHQVIPQLTLKDRHRLLGIVNQTEELNDTIDRLLEEQLSQQLQVQALDRRWFIGLPHVVAREALATWLRQQGVIIDRPMLERVAIAAKTKQPGKLVNISGTLVLHIQKDKLALTTHDR